MCLSMGTRGKYDWTCSFFRPRETTTQMANWSVQPFCIAHSRVSSGKLHYLETRLNLCTLVQPGEYTWTCASFDPPDSTNKTANQSVQPFLHSSWQKVPILYTGRPFLPNCPFSCGDLDPHLTRFLGPIQPHNPNGISIGSDVVAQMTAVSLYFTMGCTFPPQNGPFPQGDLNPHLIYGSLGPLESSTWTASQSLQPFLQVSLVWQTDRPCYSVGKNRPHLHT